MPKLLIKKTLIGMIAAVLFTAQMPLTALAATDSAALAAAQAGVNYLGANQNADGSVSGSFGGTTDWAVMAVQAYGKQAAAFSNGGASALDFMKTDVPGPASAATDVERKIIAIAATGQDAGTFGGFDYNTALTGYHVGQQIGDPTLLTDDMFGIIAADASKDPALYSTAQDGLDYLLAHQAADGGFSYTTNSCAYCGSDSSDTAAAIIAMQAAISIGLSNTNLTSDEAKATAYLLNTQQPDGGFGADIYSASDGDSTAWGLMALNNAGDAAGTQALAARDWLINNQNADGGFSYGAYGITASDTYTTAHAIIAILGTTWLLQPSPIHGSSPPPTVTGGGTKTPTVTPPSQATPADQPVIGTHTTSYTTYTTSADTPDTSPAPQVKAASTSKPSSGKTVGPKLAGAGKTSSHNIYFAVLLGIIAVMWFAVEPRKNRGEKI